MRPSTSTGTYTWTSLSRGEASDTRRNRTSDTKEYSPNGGSRACFHLRVGSAGQEGSAISTSEVRKRNLYARPGHVSFDERSNKLVTIAVESFGLPGRERSEFIDQLATGVIGGRDGEIMAEKGTCKERLLQIISVTSQFASSRFHVEFTGTSSHDRTVRRLGG